MNARLDIICEQSKFLCEKESLGQRYLHLSRFPMTLDHSGHADAARWVLPLPYKHGGKGTKNSRFTQIHPSDLRNCLIFSLRYLMAQKVDEVSTLFVHNLKILLVNN